MRKGYASHFTCLGDESLILYTPEFWAIWNSYLQYVLFVSPVSFLHMVRTSQEHRKITSTCVLALCDLKVIITCHILSIRISFKVSINMQSLFTNFLYLVIKLVINPDLI